MFYEHINHLMLGTLVCLAKSYVDRVYVIDDGQDVRVKTLARSLGFEIVRNISDGICNLDLIWHNGGHGILVALYGDGTHDPCLIPLLVSSVENGHDIALAITKDPPIEENILISCCNGLATPYSGFIACSASFTSGETNLYDLLDKAHSSSNLRRGYVNLIDGLNQGFIDRLKVGVVIPAYNEELLLGETIRGIPPYIKRVYVVDDCSTDGTPDVIKKASDPRMVSVRHEKNRGVGAAIITGYKLALADGMDIVAVMAGDNQMDPKELPRLLEPIVEGRADYAKGNRLVSKEFRKGMSRWRSFGNFLLTILTKIGSGYWHISDPQNGYTAISRKALETLSLDSVYTYYGYCNDLLTKLNVLGARVTDVAIPARYGIERSSIKYGRFIFKVAPMIFRGFLWRLKVKYIIRDFHPLVLFYISGMIATPLGVLLFAWILGKGLLKYPLTPYSVTLATLVTLAGTQFLLFAMLLDWQANKKNQHEGPGTRW